MEKAVYETANFPIESIYEAVEKGNEDQVRAILHRQPDIIWQKGGP